MDLTSLGLTLIEDFITAEEEQFLLGRLVKTEPRKNHTDRNSIRRFGSQKPYSTYVVSTTIPDYFQFLADRLVEQKLLPIAPDSISVNEYRIGQEIKPHIDSISSGPIISVLSLLSPAVMLLTSSRQKESVLLNPRSLVQMRSDIRYRWNHAIPPVQNDRYSLVFRCSNLEKK